MKHFITNCFDKTDDIENDIISIDEYVFLYNKFTNANHSRQAIFSDIHRCGLEMDKGRWGPAFQGNKRRGIIVGLKKKPYEYEQNTFMPQTTNDDVETKSTVSSVDIPKYIMPDPNGLDFGLDDGELKKIKDENNVLRRDNKHIKEQNDFLLKSQDDLLRQIEEMKKQIQQLQHKPQQQEEDIDFLEALDNASEVIKRKPPKKNRKHKCLQDEDLQIETDFIN